ncbi:MAG TPA: glyoxalase [Sutterella sp.]|nr:glyoxalase [Sutterella sp.]
MEQVSKLRLSRITKNINLIIPFYRDGLGFEILDRGEGVDGVDSVLLGHKDWPYQFEFVQIRGANDTPRAPAETYRVFCIEDEAIWKRILESCYEAGFPQVTPPPQYVSAKWPSVAYQDADGYLVVLIKGRWKK